MPLPTRPHIGELIMQEYGDQTQDCSKQCISEVTIDDVDSASDSVLTPAILCCRARRRHERKINGWQFELPRCWFGGRIQSLLWVVDHIPGDPMSKDWSSNFVSITKGNESHSSMSWALLNCEHTCTTQCRSGRGSHKDNLGISANYTFFDNCESLVGLLNEENAQCQVRCVHCHSYDYDESWCAHPVHKLSSSARLADWVTAHLIGIPHLHGIHVAGKHRVTKRKWKKKYIFC